MSYEADDMEVPAALSNLALKPQNYDKAILSRDEVRFNAQAISYNNTAKDITIRLNSAGYIDTATAYLYANIKTKYSNCQIIEEGLMGMLGQATLAVNGKIVERIEDVSELLPLLKHSCTQEWLQTEGKLAGQYRYCKSELVIKLVLQIQMALPLVIMILMLVLYLRQVVFLLKCLDNLVHILLLKLG